MAVGLLVFLVGSVLVLVGTRRWAGASGVSFWRFAFTYGHEQTHFRTGHPFQGGLRLWRDVISRRPLGDPVAESARLVVRRGALWWAVGMATGLAGWVVAALTLSE